MLDIWNPKLFVVIDAEQIQLLVTFLHLRITSAREVTTVDVRPGQRVGDASNEIEIRVQQFLLFRFWQLSKRLGGGIGKCATDTQDRLKRPRRIDEHADLRFERLSHRLKFNSAGA